MSRQADPFAHHPELRDRIIPPEEAEFYRNFDLHKVFADKPELHWVLDTLHSDATRESIRKTALAKHEGGDLWIFGYGSLMWNPALHFAEVRRARLEGYARRFILKDVFGGRGTLEAPGLMAALDSGPYCDGLLFRIREEDIDRETDVLWRRECVGPGYIPDFVTADMDGQPCRALTFVADHTTEAIAADLSFEQQVDFIATGRGFLGTSHAYLHNVVDHLITLGIKDTECLRLLHAVEQRLDQTDTPPSKEPTP